MASTTFQSALSSPLCRRPAHSGHRRPRRWGPASWFAVVIGLTQGPSCGHALVDSGTVLVPADGEVFIGKFCFGYDPGGAVVGEINLNLKAPPKADKQHLELVFFDDQASSYPGQTADWARMSCTQKLRHARATWTFPEVASHEGWDFQVNISERIRPRWWYAVISDCSGQSYNVDYQIHFANTLQSPLGELSADMHLIPSLLYVMFVVYSCVGAAQVYASYWHVEGGDKNSHPVMRILMTAIFTAVSEVVLKIAHYSRYTQDGRGVWLAYVLGKLCHEVSKFLLMSILLLVSKGRCVSSGLESGDAWKVLKLLGPFVIFCFTVEVWGEEAEANNYSDSFVYATPHGVTVLLADVALLVIYLMNLVGTWADETNPALRRFYRIWGTAYAMWFISLPVSALLSMALLAPHVRHMFATTASHVCQAIALSFLVAGLWPRQDAPYLVLGDTELADAGYKFSVGDGSCERWPTADVVGRRDKGLVL